MASRERSDLAPAWHTAALVALIVLVASVGTWLTSRGVTVAAPVASASRLPVLYSQMLLVAWGLLFYVCRVGRPRSAFAALLGDGWTTFRRAADDIVLAVIAWMMIEACEIAWVRLFATGADGSVAAMLPSTAPLRIAWVAVAVSVGLSEEVVYRGYFQTQLSAWTGRAGVAWALQAALFGLAHAEQGPSAMVRVAGYGLALGALARWRRSLVPGIVSHVLTDVVSGLVHR